MGSTQKFLIIKDRVELYKDFVINLLYYIYNYYIDKESLNAEEDIRNHYNWCFKKVCDEFLEEGIDFTKNDKLREYFYSFYHNQFYLLKLENKDISLEYYENFWRNIFNFEKQKNKSLLNILIEIYNIFDETINQEKNILEIV